MTARFTYWKESDGRYFGYLNDYPDHWTQGESLDDLKEHLKDLYRRFSSDETPGIRPYLKHWDLDAQAPGKALPDDQFHFNDCWQMCDFLKRIGLTYPLDETGHALGDTYEFFIPEGENQG